MTPRARLTDTGDGGVFLEAAFRDWEPVRELFKQAIPFEGRRWDGARKRWVVSALYVQELVAFLAWHGFQVLDDRCQAREEPLPRPPMPDDLAAAFETLHLSPTAPLAVAEASYRTLAKLFHPDARSGSVERFHEVSDAIRTVRRYLSSTEDTNHDVPF